MRLKEATKHISYDLFLTDRDLYDLESGQILCIDINSSTLYLKRVEK